MNRNRHAILVANFTYNNLRNLVSPKYDAEQLAELLNNRDIGNYDCSLILDKTSNFIKNEIENKLKSVKKEDAFLLYYSGHGIKSGDNFYLTAKETKYDAIFTTTISINDLSDIFENCVAKQKIIILDCCYSGFVDIDRIRGNLSGNDIAVLTASSSIQKAYEGDGLSHFTRYLIDGIKTGKATSINDEDITIGEIHRYIQKNLEKHKLNQQASLNIRVIGKQFPFVKNIKYIKLNKFIKLKDEIVRKSYLNYNDNKIFKIEESIIPGFTDLNDIYSKDYQIYKKNNFSKILKKSQESDNWNILISGEAGGGKTCAVLNYWSKISVLSNSDAIPYYIDLTKFKKIFFENYDKNLKKLNRNFLYKFIIDELVINKNDIDLSLIEEFLKIPKIDGNNSKKPSLIIVFDHLDNIIELKETFFSQLKIIETKFKAIQFIVVSRSRIILDLKWKEFRINDLSKNQINSYLRYNKVNTIEISGIRKIFKNPMLLFIYTGNFNNRYSYRENYAICFEIFREVNNLGELIWNYIENLLFTKTLFEKDKILYKYSLKYITSFIAKNMEENNLFYIDESQIDEILVKSLSQIDLRSYYKYYCVSTHNGCINCYKIGENEYSNTELLNRIKSIVIDEFNIISKSEKGYSFNRVQFKNYFYATYILHDLLHSLKHDNIPTSILKEPIRYPVLRLISEILMPKKEKIIFGIESFSDNLSEILYLQKGRFKSSDIGYSNWNMIEMIKMVKSDFSNLNLSYFDLSKLNIIGVKCYNNDRNSFAKFSNSKINENFIVPRGHLSTITYLQLSLDNKIFASASTDKTIKIWNFESLECIYTFRGHNDSVNCVKFNYANNTLISASNDRTILIWDLENYKILKKLKGHEDSVNSIKISNNNKYLISASDDSTIKIWSLKDLNCIKTLRGHKDSVTRMAITNDDKILISASRDFSVKIWDLENFICIKTIKEFPNSVNNIALNSDNTKMITTSFKDIKVWDTKTWEQIFCLWGHTQNISCIKINYNSDIIFSAARSSIIKMWSLKNISWIKDINLYSDSIRTIEITKDYERLLVGMSNGTIRIVDIPSAKTVKKIITGTNRVNVTIQIPKFPKVLNASKDGSIKIIDIDKQTYLKRTINLHESISKMILDNEKKHIITASISGIITVVDIKNLEIVSSFKIYSPTNLLILNNSNKLLTSYSNKMSIWDLKTSKFQESFKVDDVPINKLLLTKDDRYAIISSNNGEIKIFDFLELRCISKIKAHYMSINAMVFDNSFNLLVTAANDNTIKIWNMNTLKCIKIFEELNSVTNVLFNKNNTQLITVTKKGCIKSWDIKSGQFTDRIQVGSSVDTIILTDDNKYLVYTSKNKIYIWDFLTYKKIDELYNFSDIHINGCEFKNMQFNKSEYDLRKIIKMYGGNI